MEHRSTPQQGTSPPSRASPPRTSDVMHTIRANVVTDDQRKW